MDIHSPNGGSHNVHFPDSTHFFLYYPGAGDSTIFAKVLAVFVLLLQLLIYAALLLGGWSELQSRRSNIIIKASDCDDSSVSSLNDLECEDADTGSLINIIGASLSMVLVSLFLLRDIIGLFKGFRQKAIVSLLLLIEVIAAYLAAWVFMVKGFRVGISESIFGGVAVIFVHELDEVVKKAVDLLIQDYNSSVLVLLLPLLVPILAIGVGAVLGITVA